MKETGPVGDEEEKSGRLFSLIFYFVLFFWAGTGVCEMAGRAPVLCVFGSNTNLDPYNTKKRTE